MMRSTWFFGGMLAAALAAPACQPHGGAPAETSSETPAMTDEDMIDAQIEKFQDAWAAGDAKAIAAEFVADGDFVDPSGTSFHGREAIESRYQNLLGGAYKGTKINVTMTSTRFPEPDVAIGNGAYEIVGLKTADGTEIPPIKGLYMNVSVKEGGQWLLHCSRPMAPIAAPGQ